MHTSANANLSVVGVLCFAAAPPERVAGAVPLPLAGVEVAGVATALATGAGVTRVEAGEAIAIAVGLGEANALIGRGGWLSSP